MRSTLVGGAAAVFCAALLITGCAQKKEVSAPAYDVVIRGGTVYDGSGGKPFVGDVAIKSDRVAYVGPRADGTGKQ